MLYLDMKYCWGSEYASVLSNLTYLSIITNIPEHSGTCDTIYICILNTAITDKATQQFCEITCFATSTHHKLTCIVYHNHVYSVVV